MSIASWSLGRVVLIGLAWMALTGALVFWRVTTLVHASNGTGGLVGASFEWPTLLVLLAIVIVPPDLLLVYWVISRARARRSAAGDS